MDFTGLFTRQVLEQIYNILFYILIASMIIFILSLVALCHYDDWAELDARDDLEKYHLYLKRQLAMFFAMGSAGLAIINMFMLCFIQEYISIPEPQTTNYALDNTCYGVYDKYVDVYSAYDEQLKKVSTVLSERSSSAGDDVYVAGLREFVSQPHKKIRESVCVGNTNQYALQVEIDHLHADTDAMKDLMKHLD